MENLILLLSNLCVIVWGFFFVRYSKKETIAMTTGWAITSALICVLMIIGFIVSDNTPSYIVNAIISFGLFLAAIKERQSLKSDK